MKSFYSFIFLAFFNSFLSNAQGGDTDTLGIWEMEHQPGFLFCGSATASTPVKQFFVRVIANEQGEVRFHASLVCPTLWKGIEFLLMDEDGRFLSPLFEVFGNDVILRKVITDLSPGKAYIFRCHLRHGEICDFTLKIITSFDDSSDPPEAAMPIQSSIPNLIGLCSGTEFELSIPPVPGAEIYDWKYPRFLEPLWRNGNKIKFKIKQGESGSGEITVTPAHGCKTGIPSPPISVSSTGAIVGYVTDLRICTDLIPFLYNGVWFNDQSPKTVWTVTSDGCDSITRYNLIPYNHNVDVASFCIGNADTFEYEGEVHDVPGNYQYPATGDNPFLCASFVDLTLTESINIAPQITCLSDTFLNALSFKWDKIPNAIAYYVILNGDTVSTQTHAEILFLPDSSGQQFDLIIQPFNYTDCVFESGFTSCISEELTNLTEKYRVNQIKIFPNPSAGIFQISSFFKIEKTEVFDFSGRQVLIEKGSEIDLTNYEEGVYVLKVFTEKGVGVRRVFKF